MIEIIVEYGETLMKTGKVYYQYKSIKVCGHADNLGGTAGVKCCAGVTAIILGLYRLLNKGEHYSYEFKEGYFKLIQYDYSNKELNYYLNLVVNQLYEISKIYPQFFSEFKTIKIF